MKKILVLSDSHKQNQTIVSAINKECPDCLIFCGDLLSDLAAANTNLTCYAVKGNWDTFTSAPAELVLKIEDVNIFITHGHKYKAKQRLELLVNKANKVGAELALFGHTHKPLCQTQNNVCLLNPGSVKKGSYAVVTIDGKKFDTVLKIL